MTARKDCVLCQGTGFIIDPDPIKPVRPCECARSQRVEAAALGIPPRYRQASFESFWEWWKLEHPKDTVAANLAKAHQLLDHPMTRGTVSQDIASKLELILHRCGFKALAGGEMGWKDLKPAQEPQGYRTLYNWARSDRDTVDLWWIDGPPGSGRSSLAAAALRAWADRTGRPGLFISVRTFSQELKDTYYDSRSFKNTDFMSERDRMAPLIQAECLVLDDFDRLDADIRVVRALAQLLDQRYADELPTILTASRWAGSLQNLSPEAYPLLRLDDASLFRRLSHSRRVVMAPLLERLLGAPDGGAEPRS
ncbi:MAG: IstB-like binding protein [Holophagaceae bacterium]|nr:IstB-like binding protein [Holophagaceae bacterium]